MAGQELHLVEEELSLAPMHNALGFAFCVEGRNVRACDEEDSGFEVHVAGLLTVGSAKVRDATKGACVAAE